MRFLSEKQDHDRVHRAIRQASSGAFRGVCVILSLRAIRDRLTASRSNCGGLVRLAVDG
jgi:hypothetical protein